MWRSFANRSGPVGGFDQVGDERDISLRTGQPGLWFAAGRIAAGADLVEVFGATDQGDGEGLPAGGIETVPARKQQHV